ANVVSAPVQLTSSWQFVTVDFVTQAAGSTLDYQVYDQPVVAGEVFQADNVSIYLVPPGTAVATGTFAGVTPDSPPAEFSVRVVRSVAHPVATFAFTTTRPGPVRIELYDLTGRRVRRLLDEPSVAPGLHNVTMDGRSDQGDRLDGGVYFYRLQAAERSATGRFVIVR